ncbi:MAG: hypothetical protein WC516_06375 [Patescibacteria group bacterium]|jgi:hypothetical protein
MRTKTINIYTFNELSLEAKEKAIEQYRDLKIQDGDFLYFFSDDVCEQLKEKGWNKVISKGNKGHYCFASENQIEYDENYQDGIERKHIAKLWQNILEEIKDYYITLCKQFEKQGYDEIDYQLSDECIIEDIKANEYDFTEEGKRNIYI